MKYFLLLHYISPYKMPHMRRPSETNYTIASIYMHIFMNSSYLYLETQITYRYARVCSRLPSAFHSTSKNAPPSTKATITPEINSCTAKFVIEIENDTMKYLRLVDPIITRVRDASFQFFSATIC